MRDKAGFKELGDADTFVHFLEPETAPEVALAKAYLTSYPNAELEAFLVADNHHAFFQKMVDMDLAVDKGDAKNKCYTAFEASYEFASHFEALKTFLMATATHFSEAKG